MEYTDKTTNRQSGLDQDCRIDPAGRFLSLNSEISLLNLRVSQIEFNCEPIS